MMWLVKVHPLVLEEDFKKISPFTQKIIIKAIRRKLTVEPEKYGEPLRKELKGFWKLRISEYRVIYRIEKELVRVLVIKVGFRKDEQVYKEMISRLRHLL